MSLTSADFKNLLVATRGEDTISAQFAMNDLLLDIQQNKMSAIYRYKQAVTNANYLDGDDLESVFLMACYEAILIADIEKGDPMRFVINRGQQRVIDEIRKSYRRTLKQHCKKCNSTTRTHSVAGAPTCPKCGASGEYVKTEQVVHGDDGTTLNTIVGVEGIDDQVHDKLILDGFKSRLSGRVLDVYELIVEQGYDRGACKNYIADVAEELQISKPNVNKRLRSLRDELTAYLAEINDEEREQDQTEEE